MAYSEDTIYNWTDDEGIRNWSNNDRSKAFREITQRVQAKRQGLNTGFQQEMDIDPEEAYQKYINSPAQTESLLNLPDSELDLTKPEHRKVKQQRNIENRSEFTRGLLSGIDETQGMLYGAAGLVGGVTGIDKLRDWGFKNYKRNLEEAELNPVTIGRIEDIDSVGDAADWFAGVLGKLAPTMGEIAASAGIGAFVGGGVNPAGAVAGALNRGLVKKYIKKEMIDILESKAMKAFAQEMGEDAARKVAMKQVGRKIGGNIGMVIGSSALEAGGMYADELEKHGPEKANAWSSLAFGVASGATELVAPSGSMVRKVIGLPSPVKTLTKAQASKILKNAGTKKFVGSMLKAVPGAMGKEAVQEFTQELLGTLNSFVNDPSESLLSEENLSRYANAAAAGAAAGVLFGAGEGISKYRADKREAREILEGVAPDEEAGLEDEEIDEFLNQPGISEEIDEVLNNAWSEAEERTGTIKPLSDEEIKEEEISVLSKRIANLQTFKKPTPKQVEKMQEYQFQLAELKGEKKEKAPVPGKKPKTLDEAVTEQKFKERGVSEDEYRELESMFDAEKADLAENVSRDFFKTAEHETEVLGEALSDVTVAEDSDAVKEDIASSFETIFSNIYAKKEELQGLLSRLAPEQAGDVVAGIEDDFQGFEENVGRQVAGVKPENVESVKKQIEGSYKAFAGNLMNRIGQIQKGAVDDSVSGKSEGYQEQTLSEKTESDTGKDGVKEEPGKGSSQGTEERAAGADTKPWEMSLLEYGKSQLPESQAEQITDSKQVKSYAAQHRKEIQAAVDRGDNVPENVLNEYPDLASDKRQPAEQIVTWKNKKGENLSGEVTGRKGETFLVKLPNGNTTAIHKNSVLDQPAEVPPGKPDLEDYPENSEMEQHSVQKRAEMTERAKTQEPWQFKKSEYAFHPDADKVPKGSVLAEDPRTWTKENLKKKKNLDLERISIVLGIAHSGNKAKKIDRIMKVVEIRKTLRDMTAEQIEKEYKLPELTNIVQDLIGKKATYLRKADKARYIKSIIERMRGDGRRKIAEAKHHAIIKEAIERGENIPQEVMEDYQYLVSDKEEIIGQNPDGEKVYKDKRGARYYIEDGHKITQPVRVAAGEGVEVDSAEVLYHKNRTQFLSTEEIREIELAEHLKKAQSEMPEGFSIIQKATPAGDKYVEVLKDGETYKAHMGYTYTEHGINEAVRLTKRDLQKDKSSMAPAFPNPGKTVKADSIAKEISPEEAAAKLDAWKSYAQEIREKEDHSNEVILSLFDRTGAWSQPYVDAGYTVIRYDAEKGDDIFSSSPLSIIEDATENGKKKLVGILSAPPCTSFSSSGARWWANQHDVDNPVKVKTLYGAKAAQMFDSPIEAAEALGGITQIFVEVAREENHPLTFYSLENPRGRIAKKVGLPKPTLTFQPNNYGDPYTKETMLWGEFNADLPQANIPPSEGSRVYNLRGSDPEQKAARSITPDGFAYSFFVANNTSQIKFKEEKAAGSLKEQLKAEWAKQAKEQQEKEEKAKKPSTAGMSPELAYRKEYQYWIENGRQGNAPDAPAYLEPHALKNIQKSVEADLKSDQEKTKPAEAREYKEDMAKAAKDAKESASKMMDALKNVNKILGERGSFSTEETDENTYKLISEQLNIAWKHAQDAGKSVAEFVTIAMEALTHKATPYFNRWVEESIDESGRIIDTERKPTEKEAADETTATDTRGQGVQNLGAEDSETVSGGRDGTLAGTGRDRDTAEPGDTVETSPATDVSETAETGDTETDGVRPGVQDAGDSGQVQGGRDAEERRPDGSVEGMVDEGPGGTGRNRLKNYHIQDPELLVGGTPKKRFQKNQRAIETYNELIDENRDPTETERDILAGYIGWGSFGQELFQGTWETPKFKDGWQKENEWLRNHLGESAWKSAQSSILNAHYTDPPTVTTVWEILQKMGFDGGQVLEPAVGVGNFFGLMPRDLEATSDLTGIELDETTAGIAKMLYPKANIQQMGYQQSKTADGFYDVVVGNWPFAQIGPADRRYNKFRLSLHDYFFVKALDQVRPGGFVVGITSSGTMDKKAKVARLQMAKRGDLVAAFRMPSGAFKKYAGTSVVADLIVMQKRAEGAEANHHGKWDESVPLTDQNGNPVTREDGSQVFVNEYWAAHPDHVLGEMTVGHGTTQGREGMIVNRPDNYGDILSAVSDKVPENIMTPRNNTDHVRYISNNTDERQNSITTAKDGLYVVRGERLANLNDISKYAVKSEKTTADRESQIKGLVDIRNAYGRLLDMERDGKDGIEEARKELKAKYDNFTKAHGSINQSYGIKVFDKVNDPMHAALVSLENNTGTKKKPVYKPAQIFTKSTQRSKPQMKNPSIAEAFVLGRNENALRVDLEWIAEKAQTTVDVVKKELTDNNAIFETPSGVFEVADIYLSGNVKQKLREAKEAQQAGKDMAGNIKALEKVIPADTPYFQIEASLGATWVPQEVYQDFISDLGNLPEDIRRTIRLTPSINGWIVKFDNESLLNSRSDVQTMWGTPGSSFTKVIRSAFTGSPIVIRSRDADGNMVVDRDLSRQANEKVDEVRDRFKDWVWAEVDRRVMLEQQYNEVMNAFATPQYDGSFLNFDGMALQLGEQPFNLRQHQVNAIWRGIANGRGLYAHEVGTGKTFTMAGIAVESRRYGLARKPLIVAHNANSGDVAADVNVMYPGAKVLYIDNLTPKTIQSKLYQIANDDWDAIVMPHSLLPRLTLSRETLDRIAAEEIAALEAEAIDSALEEGFEISTILDDADALKKVRGASTAKELVKQRNRILENIERQAQTSSKEGAVTFESLGIDMMIVDEAHVFKKPPLSTRMKVKGLNTAPSSISIGLNFLTSYIKETNAGKGVHTFTGTPITNTLNEVYNQMRYVMSDKMDEAGIQSWDAWFNTFAGIESDVEMTAAGDFQPVSRLTEFNNVTELRRFAGQYMDIVFADDMPEFKPRPTKSGKTMKDKNLTDAEKDELRNGRVDEGKVVGRPYKKVLNDVADMSPDQEDILRDVMERAQSFRNATPRERKNIMLSGDRRNPVVVETDAAKAGFDARLYDRSLSDYPNNKINRAVKNIMEHYVEHDKATQVVFMEKGFSDTVKRTKKGIDGEKVTTTYQTFNAAKDLIEKLVTAGIPREQIASVTGKTTKKKRQEIAEAMNRAEIKVVIGQTATLGTGVNMQENLRAIHHLDAPWMPGELEQRNGRGHRQGNRWNTVLEYRYITNRIDGKRWQVLAKKQKMITDFLKAKEGVRSVSGDVLDLNESSELEDITSSFSDAAGDARILVRAKLQKDVEKLLRRERTHDQGTVEARRKAEQMKRRIPGGVKQLEDLKSDLDHYESVRDQPLNITIEGKVYTKKKEANAALEKLAVKLSHSKEKDYEQVIGSYRGFELVAEINSGEFSGVLFLLQRDHNMEVKPSIASMNAHLRNMQKDYDKKTQQLADWQSSITKLEAVSKEKFGQADLLARKREMLQQLESDLQMYPEPPPAWLAQAAPIGTDVYIDGTPATVDGHRQGDHDYYLLITKEDGSSDAVPYQDVMDENGMPVYEGIEEKPTPSATLADQFEKAYDKVSESGRNAYIYQIKDELDWTEDEVNEFIEKQMVEGTLAGLPGDPSRLTQEQRDRSFFGSDGEQYIAVSKRRELVNTEDAQYSITSTAPWPEGFPPIYGHTNTATLKKQPGYNAAKAGDLQAAAETVSAVVKPERIKNLGEKFPNAMVVAVHSEEETGRNKLPEGLARAISNITGLPVDDSIIQSRRAEHSKKNAAQRILSRAEYDGEVVKGQEYILVDDVVTAGGTLSELRHYIENNGGKVVAISSLSYARGSGNLALQTKTLNNLKKRFDQNELETLLQEYNVSGNLEAITESEGRYLLKFKTIDAIRNRFSQERQAGSRQVLYSLLQRESADLKSIPPASALSSSEIQGLFKKQKVIIQDNGEISVQFKNGHGLVIESIERVSDKDYELAYRSGQMDKDGIIAGRHTPGRIQIVEGIADYITLVHELEHELESSGIFQKTDINLLDSHAKKLIRQGKITKNKIAAENRANALGYIIDNRKQYRGTRLGWIAQKVMDFIDAVLHIGRASIRKLARDIERGRVFSRQPGGEGGQAATMFEAAPKVGTRAFKDWFKDSKVVDKDGKPLVVYHGTAANFTEFDKNKIGSNYGTDDLGFFFASTKDEAEYSATEAYYKAQESETFDEEADDSYIIPVYLSLRNPLIVTAGTEYDAKFGSGNATNTFDQNRHEIIADMEEGEHDGLIVRGTDGEADIYMALEPTQIKSAIGNRGTYDPNNPDIRYTFAGLESRTADKSKALHEGMPMFQTVRRTDTPAFKKWFGKSKATNKKGQPITFYHGTPETFTVFQDRAGKSTKHGSSGLGYFFSGSLQSAKHYAGQGGNVIKGYLRMEKPYKMSLKEAQSFETVEESKKRRQQLENKGYDSIVLIVPGGNPVFIVFKPNQVKSVQNTGLWSTTDDDINYNLNQDFKDLQSKVSKDSLMQELEPAAEEALTQQQKAVRSLFKKVFGRDVLYFDSQDKRARKINGFALAVDPSKVFINIASDSQGARPPLFVAAHETMHTIETEDPQLYRWMEKQLQAYIKMEGFENFLQEKSYYEKVGKDPGREFLPEMFAEAINQPKFWDHLFAQDKSKFEKLINYLLKMIRKIKAWARKEGLEHYFTDVDAALKIMADAVKRMDTAAPGFRKQIENEISTKPGEDIQYDIFTGFSDEVEIDSYKNISSGIKGIWQNRKNKGEKYKQDIGVLENVFGLISHYSDKVPGLQRTFHELLRRPEWKFMKENDLSKEGEYSLLGALTDLQKANKTSYNRLKEYLVKQDLYQIGNVIKRGKDSTWEVFSPEKDLLKKGFRTKRKAMEWSIKYEVSQYGDSAGAEALRAFRTMVLNLHDYYSETWNEIAEEYEARGMTVPPVVIQTSSGQTHIELKTALAKMGDRSTYYFPRLRQNGDWRVIGTKEGEREYIDFRDTKIGADALAGKLQAKGYAVIKEKVGKFSEDLFSDIRNALSVQVAVNQALAETKLDTKNREIRELGINAHWDGQDYVVENGGQFNWSAAVLSEMGAELHERVEYQGNTKTYLPGYIFRDARKDIDKIVLDSLLLARGNHMDIAFELAEGMAKQLSDEIKGRGSRARMIARAEREAPDPIGYETDPVKAMAQTISAAAGGEAKKQVALRASRAITGRHLSWKEYMKQHPYFEEIQALEEEKESLSANTEEEKKTIKQINDRIKTLQQERTGVKTETVVARQRRLEEIRSLYNDLDQMQKWHDTKKLGKIKRDIARLRIEIHDDYKTFIRENMIHPKKQKRALSDAMNAIEHVLKNDEAADRVINTLKGLVSVWFLGGRVSSAAVNLTAMGTSVPAAMNAYGDIPLKRTPQLIAKATKAYAAFATGKGTLSGSDRAILEDIESRGWMAAQLNMETMKAMKSGPAKGYSRVAELLMTPFKITEEFNRAVTLLAAYKGVKANTPGISTEDALQKAKTISDRAHGIYGKENDPALLRKGRGLRAFSTMYIFQRFFHNYLSTMAQMIGRRQAKAAAYMLISPVVFGGAGATLAMPVVKAIFAALDLDDPEEQVYDTALKYFGETGETIARYGVPGIAGVSLKGSLTPNLPDFSEPIDILGPVGGMARNIWDGGKNLTHGEYLKGMEGITPPFIGNVFKGYRETTEGVTTRAGDPVFFGNEQIQGDLGTGLLRAGGFNPVQISKPREIQWNETLLRRRYTERKSRLYSRIVQYFAKPAPERAPAEWADILYDIRKFNARVRSNNLERLVPLISSKTVKARIRRAFRPAKRERLR